MYCIHPTCRLPGAFAWGYIACTGTNFCIRVRALAHCGWFPEYTITEDYALGMELKVGRRAVMGHKGIGCCASPTPCMYAHWR
jgi:cellulose synthase/poly-beta-1,6-N-acetylglucosamine synthase-like glycosyltransferase